MVKIVCDRCGASIDRLVSDNQLVDYSIVEITTNGRNDLDLCPKCKNELVKWLNPEVKSR